MIEDMATNISEGDLKFGAQKGSQTGSKKARV